MNTLLQNTRRALCAAALVVTLGSGLASLRPVASHSAQPNTSAPVLLAVDGQETHGKKVA